ncbi:hypothetical protein [Streptomyces cellulosae]|uniref:Uncharacterized protein n=1 Tax=Streptomyces cellulosae TaxID=1968 RepID=A0ABW7YI25_STRCE
MTLSGLLVLYRVLRRADGPSLLAQIAAAAAVATAAIWAVLQGLDGVGLKQAADSWVSASGAEKTIRFANAETVRWLEWGFQSYFRILLGLTLALFGTAILTSRRIAGWLGWTALVAGVCSGIVGVDVGYSGLASGLQDILGITFPILVLVFGTGYAAADLKPEAGRHFPHRGDGEPHLRQIARSMPRLWTGYARTSTTSVRAHYFRSFRACELGRSAPVGAASLRGSARSRVRGTSV